MEAAVGGRFAEGPSMGIKHTSMEVMQTDEPAGKSGSPCMPPSCPTFFDGHGHLAPPPEHCISAEYCRAQLGDRTFNVLRQAMLHQQETFIEQLWDLHRLTRSQGRRVALLHSEPRIVQEPPDSDMLSRQRQEQIRNQTMHEISQLPSIPSSLRVSFATNPPMKDCPQPEAQPSSAASPATVGPGMIRASMPAGELAQASMPVAHATPHRIAGYTGPVFAAPLGRGVAYPPGHLPGSPQPGFAFAGDGTSGHQYSWAPGSAHVGSSAFSAQPASIASLPGQSPLGAPPNHAYLTSLPQQSGLGVGVCNPGYPGVAHLQHTAPPQDAEKQAQQAAALQTNGNKPEAQQAQQSQQQATQVDVSSLLNMMAPGLPGVTPDIHSQWISKNFNGAGMPLGTAGVTSSGLLGLPPGAMEPMGPLMPESKPMQSETTPSHHSNSVWSGSTLFVPAGASVQCLPHQQATPLLKGGLVGGDGKAFAGLPSAAAMLPPEIPAGDVQARSGSSMPLAPASGVEQGPGQKGAGTCHTDESAATILMSLKGS